MRKNRARKDERPSRASPWVAGICSLFLPGLGQALARSVWRGVLVFGSVASIVGILIWRVDILGHLQKTAGAKLAKAF